MTNPSLRLITILLDRSGSMEPIKADAEGGLAAFLDTQKDVPARTLVTLRQFDHQHETVFELIPLEQVPQLPLHPRGGTALLDAIGSTLATTAEQLAGLPEGDRPGEVVVVIITDGHENSSRDWTLASVKASITRHQQEDGWTVVYLGADQDAITVAREMGIGAETSLSYSSHNTRESMTTAGRSVARGSRTGEHTFTDDERKGATS